MEIFTVKNNKQIKKIGDEQKSVGVFWCLQETFSGFVFLFEATCDVGWN